MSKPADKQWLMEEMRRWGIRVTAQRLAVAEVLTGCEDHPTAQEVYRRVQERLPHITIATVYNALGTLARSGFIQPLPFPSGTRYDANPGPHANVVCIRCRTITDIPDDGTFDHCRRGADGSGFQVLSQRVDFYGFCSNCRPAAGGSAGPASSG